MAHQAHAIPWRSFASNFEYTTRPHIGPLPRLYVVESSNGLKDFQHFANVFAKRIREFGASERAKYASSESLKTRAEFWKKSDIDSEIDVSEVAPEMEGSRREEGRKAGQKSREPQVQGRKVYSDAFKAKYEIAYVDWPSYQIESKQDVANWTGSFDEGSCIDTLKILMMEAAAASLPFSDRVEGGIAQKQAMESLLLLANKRDVASSMRYWKHRGNGAHNYGIDMVAEKALCAYLMFNLFFSMRENGSGICKMEAGQAWPKERSCWYRAYMVPEETEALRPGYMNTHLWVNVVGFVSDSNYYNSEQLMHRTFLFPEWQGPYRKPEVVRDVLSEGDELREYLKGLWRVLVVFEVFWKEMGADIDWEQVLADILYMNFKVKMVYNKEKGRMWFS